MVIYISLLDEDFFDNVDEFYEFNMVNDELDDEDEEIDFDDEDEF